MLDRLPEADAGVDPGLGHPGGGCLLHPCHEVVADLGDDVVVARLGLHRAGLALHVHRHPADAGGGRDRVDEADTSLIKVAPASMAASVDEP